MKILMTTDTVGGVWTFTMDLLKALEVYNVEVLLVTMGGYPTAHQIKEVRDLNRVSMQCSSFKLEWMENPWADLEEAKRWIMQLSVEFNPDVVHLNSFSFDASLFSAPVLMVGHSCVLSWWRSVKGSCIPSTWNRYERMVKKSLQSADVVTAPSKTMLSELQYFYGPLHNTHAIYNAGNPFFFRGHEKKKKIAFSMGRLWDEAKNIKLLLEAARWINYPVYIAGEQKDALRDIQVPANVFFLGQKSREEVAWWLSQAEVYVLPALYEPFGLSVLEAAYSGCTLVLGRIPSLIEIWGDHALYCDPFQPIDLAAKINEVLRDESLSREYSLKAQVRSSRYSLPGMASAYHSLYKELVKNRSLAYRNVI